MSDSIIHVRIDGELKRKLRIHCAGKDITMQEVIEDLVLEWVTHQDAKNAMRKARTMGIPVDIVNDD